MSWSEALLAPHADLERALVIARLGVVAGDPAAVGAWLDHLDALLAPHLALEEAVLLPIWARSEAAPPNGTAEVLLDDHARLRALGQGVRALPAGAPLLAGLGRLGGVLEHHDAREAAGFVPWVSARLDGPAERAVAETLEVHAAARDHAPDLPQPGRRGEVPLVGDTLPEVLAAVREALACDAEALHFGALRAALERRLALDPGPGATAVKARRILDRAEAALVEGEETTRRLSRLAAFDQLGLLGVVVGFAG